MRLPCRGRANRAARQRAIRRVVARSDGRTADRYERVAKRGAAIPAARTSRPIALCPKSEDLSLVHRGAPSPTRGCARYSWAMSQRDDMERLRRVYDERARGELWGADIYDPEIVFVLGDSLPEPGIYEGLEGFLERGFRGWLESWRDLRFELDELIPASEAIVAHDPPDRHWSGKWRPHGARRRSRLANARWKGGAAGGAFEPSRRPGSRRAPE